MIWKLLLTTETAAYGADLGGRKCWHLPDTRSDSAKSRVSLTSELLRASRFLYADTGPILYGMDTFMVSYAWQIDAFKKAIGA